MIVCTQDFYRMNGVTAADWNKLVKNFEGNDTLFQDFCHNYKKRAPTVNGKYVDNHCNLGNRTNICCELRSSKSGDLSKCNSQEEKLTIHEFDEKKKPRSFSTEL